MFPKETIIEELVKLRESMCPPNRQLMFGFEIATALPDSVIAKISENALDYTCANDIAVHHLIKKELSGIIFSKIKLVNSNE